MTIVATPRLRPRLYLLAAELESARGREDRLDEPETESRLSAYYVGSVVRSRTGFQVFAAPSRTALCENPPRQLSII